MTTQLVATKYRMPPVNTRLVERPRLMHCLDEAICSGRRLVLISAPAGYGKTTAILQWINHRQRSSGEQAAVGQNGAGSLQTVAVDCAWLTVDALDNDPLRFLAYFMAALCHASSLEYAKSNALIQDADLSSIPALLPVLANEIASASRRTVVILDDYHEIAAQPVHDIIAFLLKYAPENLHVVLCTRVDPPLPLAQLRGRNQMSELRQHDLRLTDSEAAEVLAAWPAPALSPALLKMLNQRTEGWIAGLQMAAISLNERGDPAQFVHAFSGSHRHILDYLSEEVLNSQPQSIQRFLMHTSILERLCAPLCQAVLGDPCESNEMQVILEQLEQRNLFVIPLDQQRQWYRYHQLFRELLYQRLTLNEPELVPTLHHCASQWFSDAGLMHDAVEHALKTGDKRRAAGLIAYMAETVMKGSEVATLRRWIETLPAEAIQTQPVLHVYYAGALLLMGEASAAVEEHLRAAFAGNPDDDLAGAAITFQALAATLQGDNQKSDRLARRALTLLPKHSPFFCNCVSLIVGINHLFAGDDSAALAALRDTIRLSDPDNNIMNSVLARCYLGQLFILQGRLNEANELYEQALADSKDEPIGGLPLLGLGLLHYDWNDLTRADMLITCGLERVGKWSELPIAQGALLLARIKTVAGDATAAHTLERCTEAMLARCTDMTPVCRSLQLYLMHYSLWKNDLSKAQYYASNAGLNMVQAKMGAGAAGACCDDYDGMHAPADSMEATFVLNALAQLYLAQGRYDEASAVALRVAEHSLAYGRMRLVAKAQIIHALARFACGDEHAALAAIGQALAICAPENSIRLFIDEGEKMAELLLRCRKRALFAPYVARLLAALHPESEPIADDPQPTHSWEHDHESLLIIEPLSEREYQVLQLMAAGQSNREIAHRLAIAPSTVKTHIHSIFRKLQATRRTQAIARAQAWKFV